MADQFENLSDHVSAPARRAVAAYPAIKAGPDNLPGMMAIARPVEQQSHRIAFARRHHSRAVLEDEARPRVVIGSRRPARKQR